jgi:hypothetical protein
VELETASTTSQPGMTAAPGGWLHARGSAKTIGVDPTLLPKGDGAEQNRWSLEGG